MPHDDIPISVYMITFNNERTLEAALKSVQWADDIVVVDSFSTDRTPEIARRYTERFEQREWPGFRDQYQYASEQCTHDWALFIDADEEISPEMADEIRAELRANAGRPDEQRVAGYHCCRRTLHLGRWILHGAWVPDHEIRLYDRRRGTWKGGLHAKIHVDGPEAFLEQVVYHYTYANISEQLQTIDRYTTAAAQEMHEAGKRASILHALGNPVVRFLKEYILKRGFLDGFPGLVIAVCNMFYAFVKYAKLWEIQHPPDEEAVRARRP